MGSRAEPSEADTLAASVKQRKSLGDTYTMLIGIVEETDYGVRFHDLTAWCSQRVNGRDACTPCLLEIESA